MVLRHSVESYKAAEEKIKKDEVVVHDGKIGTGSRLQSTQRWLTLPACMLSAPQNFKVT